MTDRESRLDALRDEARARGRVGGDVVPIAGGPIPVDPASYYGLPVLKAPVWTWEIPAYFFVGGLAGMAAMIAAAAGLSGADSALARDARLIAAAGAVVSPLLLIADLGRPARFLNMLRVFKPRSAMSVGAWTLVAFSGAVVGSVLWHTIDLTGPAAMARAGNDLLAGILGLILATYTGVLLGVSTVPVWAAHAGRLPLLFAASSLGAAVSAIELAGHRTPAANLLGIAAAAGELGISLLVSFRSGDASRPLRSGGVGAALRIADLGGAGLPLVLRLILPASSLARVVAATVTLAGALVLRYGWMAAGRVSTGDPAVVLDGPQPT
jgi:formate-dependent nitrite reductase membrane component NrfD